ncbi:hypothetical protein [Frigoriglobus tundricola]|uniref:Cytochrome c domain-containing protein n=1 Tax=Frigoriglobus tundricola TaxID=2774151 RepID=A0A6M5YUB1_9BACT|nr:hypothetical protein [Frigoriglobus tundricola]QJW97677.1 hypothetical protein FTUN_5254 [Frigoriglobus tundricola]
MKTAFPYRSGLVALTLTFAVAVVPAPAAPSAPVLDEAPPPHESVRPHAHTAIGAVIEANGWKLPATGAELTTALTKLGDFVQLPVTFSAVALHSGLTHPRVVITMRPSTHPAPVEKFVPDGRRAQSFGGWSGPSAPSGTTKLFAGTPAPLGTTPTNKPYLEGRLFLAANTDVDGRGQPVVKTVEFISWNSRKQKFDFGVIEGMGGGQPELKTLDGVRCFSCHKNRGPILGVAPWSNTAHNDLVRATSAPLLKFTARFDKDGQENANLGLRDDIDGLRLLGPSRPEVDAAVRQGADVLRDRERFKLLVRTSEGRKALTLLLGALVTKGPLDKVDQKLALDLNVMDLVTFMRDAHAANKAVAPSALADYSPAGPVNLPVGPNGPTSAATQLVTRYDALRAAGAPALPTEHQPSNPKAFVRPALPAPSRPTQLISAVMLARAIGLSEDDRAFLAKCVDDVLGWFNDPQLTAAAVTKAILTGPHFADVFQTGTLPERDDFKDRFAAGSVDLLRTKFPRLAVRRPRAEYASTPKFDAGAEPEAEAAAVPSHACLACHDVRTGAKPAAFNPIPALAFDPFDTVAREAWLQTTDRKKKVAVLSRLVKRIGTDKDMPPEDSAEAEVYRTKDPAALAAVRNWLDAELKKVK